MDPTPTSEEVMEDNPFPDTVIADWNFLDSSQRSPCPTCRKSRKYYCYTCYAPLPHLTSGLPKVKLPVKVDIIKHPSETDGKSTAPHAAILAPDDVVIHTYPCIPDYDLDKVVLVFPGEESMTLDELAAVCSEEVAHNSLLEEEGQNASVAAESRASFPVSMNERPQTSTSDLDSDLSDTQLLARTDDSKVHSLNGDEKNIIIPDSDTSQSGQGGDSQSGQGGDSQSGQGGDSQSGQGGDSQSGQGGDSQTHKRSLCDITSVDNGGQHYEPPTKKTKIFPRMPFEKVVFIDATWNQTHNIISDERLKNLKKVELRTRNSNFWRCQEGVPKTYLSTIEAIFYFVKDLHSLFIGSDYKHEYDNLLFFFGYIYNKIQKSSKGGKGIKAYQR